MIIISLVNFVTSDTFIIFMLRKKIKSMKKHLGLTLSIAGIFFGYAQNTEGQSSDTLQLKPQEIIQDTIKPITIIPLEDSLKIEPLKETVSIPPKDSIEGKIIELQTVEVIGRARKDYNSNYSFSAAKIALKNMEITQAVSTVTKELFADRQAFRLGDVLKNVSGVSTVSFYNHYAIRGVTQSSAKRESRLVNGMRTTMVYYS